MFVEGPEEVADVKVDTEEIGVEIGKKKKKKRIEKE